MGIMRHLLLLSTMLGGAGPVFATQDECALEYRFTLHSEAEPRRFQVELLFDAGSRHETGLRIAQEWGGVTNFERAIQDVRGGGEAFAVSPGGDSKKAWKVVHPSGGRVRVQYDLLNDVANVDARTPLQPSDFFREMIGSKHFQIYGWGALLVPDAFAETAPVAACMTFSGLGEGAFASSYGDGQADGVAKLRMRASPLELRSAVYLGGDFRVHRRDIEGRPLVVALRGEWGFDDAQFVEATASVVGAERRFWNDDAFPHYLVSLIPNRVPHGSTGGTSLRNSFAMHASSDFAVPSPSFDVLIAHEHMHTWIPRRIGTMGEYEALRYWFSEGFTDYLAHRLLLASGAWSLDDYAKALDTVVLRYESSNARNASNAVVAREFWQQPAAQRIPYFRGELLALRWSGAMAARGASLEATLRKLRRDTDWTADEPAGRSNDLAVNRLAAALREDLGASVDRDFAAYVEAGETIPVSADFLGPCFRGERKTRPLFELGFDAPNSQSRKVTHLVAGSAAEKAGLREGMTLAGWSIYGGNVNKEVEVQIQDGDSRRTVKYLPHAAHGIDVYEFHALPGAAAHPDCRRWIEAQ